MSMCVMLTNQEKDKLEARLKRYNSAVNAGPL